MGFLLFAGVVVPFKTPFKFDLNFRSNVSHFFFAPESPEINLKAIFFLRHVFFRTGSVNYLSFPCFSTIIGGIGGPAVRAKRSILGVMFWISVIRRGLEMVRGSIPTGDVVTGLHSRGTVYPPRGNVPSSPT